VGRTVVSARLLRLLAPGWPRFLAASLLLAATLASGLGLMGSSGWLLARAAEHPSIAALSVAIVGVRFFGISRGVFRYLERLLSHDVTLRLLARLRVEVYAALEPLSPARLAARGGDLLSRIVADVETLEGAYVRVLGPTLAALVVAGIVAALLLPASTPVAAATLVGLLLAGTVVPVLAGRLGERPGRRLVETRGSLTVHLVDGVLGIADLLAFDRGRAHAEEVHSRSLALAAAQERLARVSGLGGALAGLAADVTVVAVLWLAVPGVRRGEVGGPGFAAALLLALASFEAVAGFGAAHAALGAIRTAARRLFALLDEPPQVVDPPSPSLAGPGASLQVRQLRFSYPASAAPALDGVSLRLERGRTIALVGPSGSGKSTLLHLLLRFDDAPPGTLFLDGVDLRDLSAEALRSRIAWMDERPHVFNATLRDNLLLARPDADARARADALRQAGLVIETWREGEDTWLGEEGQRLSGGERQRLALARAFLPRAPLRLLDEPTAHLDAAAAQTVIAEIRGSAANHATLLVTHRLRGLEWVDEILVLQEGRVAERGAFADLAARKGLFSRMLDAECSLDLLERTVPEAQSVAT
jgi:ATP-binding cassette subfamily C protein CydC